jgi:hypothetical protein
MRWYQAFRAAEEVYKLCERDPMLPTSSWFIQGAFDICEFIASLVE